MSGFAFLGLDFIPAIRLSIGGLTNSAAVLGSYPVDLTGPAQALIIFSMILGRLEVLALIPALSLSFWRG